jgi:membrane peptidoglycan carboxypeptidase
MTRRGRRRRARPGLRRRPWWRRFVRTSTRVVLVVVIGIPLMVVVAAGTGGGLLLFGELPGTVPKEREIVQAIPSTVYDAYGNQIGEFRQFDLNLPLAKEDIPQHLKDAVVASEDRTFWIHKGVDFEGITRAGLAIRNSGEVVQGGSTITQQYVRARYLNNERSVERKLNEVLLATRFERQLTEELGSAEAAKDEILFQYLNTTYFGGGAYGVSAAAQTYFRKNVKDLTLSESAALVAVIPSPSRYGLRENVTLADQRRIDVLDGMLELSEAAHEPGDKFEGITQAQYDEAKGQHLWWALFGVPDRPATIFHPPPQTTIGTYPYFVDYVRQYLIERYGADKVYRGGMRIETTIDPRLQQLADQAVAGGLKGTGPPLEMSLVTVEPSTGFVKALVGGRDFNASQVNLALGGITGMQPGSAFKTFTVAKALEEGFGVDTSYGTPGSISIGGYTFKGGGGGGADMRNATAQSVNTYFVQLIRDVGPNKVAEMAHRLGVSRITLDKNYGLSLTLGAYEVSPLDMAQAYATLANHGVKADATPIVKITLPDGSSLEDNTGPRGTRVVSAAVADWTTDLLTSVAQPGATGARAAIPGRAVAGKTGTAEKNTAVWFVGYTPQLSTAIWAGYTDRARTVTLPGVGTAFGGTAIAPVWRSFMEPALEGQPAVPFAPPGILPAPTGGGRRRAEQREIPSVVRDCGGPCINTTDLTTPPPTTAPPTTTTTLPEEGEAVPGGGDTAATGAPPEPTPTEPPTSSTLETTTTTAPRRVP